MPNLETEEYKLSMNIRFTPKKTWEQVECPECHGTGKPRIHFGPTYDDEPTECQRCFGRRTIDVQIVQKTKPPNVPQELVDHMLKAYLEWKLK